MKILDFVVCEDIRREEGGKFSLMGIIDEVSFRPNKEQKEVEFPVIFPLSIFSRLQGLPENTKADCLELEFIHDGSVYDKTEVPLQLPDLSKIIVLGMKNRLTKFPGTGKIAFNLKVKNEGEVIAEQAVEYKFTVNAPKE